MITQEFDINIVPHGLPPRVEVDQYDTGLRTLIAHIYQDDTPLVMTSDYTYTVIGTKPSGTGFSYPATAENGAIVIDVTGQMTVVSGLVECGIIVWSGTDRVGTHRFNLWVQPSALPAETIIDANDFNSVIVSALAAKGLLVTDTASGSLASFPDGADGMPIVILTAASATEIYRAGKNILPFPYMNSTSTSGGVTRTVNADGTISLSGTATAESTFIYTENLIDTIKPNVGDVLVFTDGLEYASNRYSRLLWANNREGIGAVNGSRSVTITNEHLTRGIYYGLRIVSGANCNGITIKPMVRVYGDDTYEPYAVQTFAVGDDVTTVHGANSIWADTGDVSVEYVADTKMYIDKRIAEV